MSRSGDERIMCFFFLMIRRPPRSTQSRSSAASDVYKRQDSSETVLKSFAIQKSNQTPGDGEIALFYGMYENTTEANHVYNPCAYNFEGLKSWVVKSAETALPNSANDFYGIGTIASNENQLDLQIGQFAIASNNEELNSCLLYTSPSPRDRTRSRMPSSA